MKKVFGQTVRDIKREVNKKVLKVPEIERKVLDATSNESWGPHGTLLADIAVASRNYHEYQMIMAVIWKRINDTGKNWRHVYKALIVLEYLVANGSERVIDEIREHGHQISTLADFQYVDSNGRDQGSTVRRKSQSLVMLLNDKEQIVEVRQKAAANRDKFCNTNPGSGMYTPGGYGERYDDDRYNGRDEYGYGRDREGGYKDDDRSSRNGDSYSRDGDHYSRHSEEHYGRDSCREDDHRDKQNGSRTSVDREGDHSLDGDGQYSARGLDREFSDQSISGPPSYEEVVGESRSSTQNERDQKTSSASVPKHSSPIVSNDAGPTANIHAPSPPPTKQEFEGFDEFDPRVSAPATSSTVNKNDEMDLLGSLSDSSPSKSSSTMPAKSTGSEADAFAANTGFRVSDVMQQPFDDPFGDSPFKALPSNDNSAAAKPSVDQPAPSFPPSTNQNSGLHQQAEPLPSFGFGDSLSTLTFVPPDSSQFPSHGISNPEEEIDILAGILPPSGPSSIAAAQNPFSAPSEHLQLGTTAYGDFSSQGGPIVATAQVSPHTGMQYNHGNFHNTSGNPTPFSASSSLEDAGVYGDFGSQAGPTTSVTLQMSHQMQTGTDLHSNHGHLQQQTGPTASPFSAQSGQPAQPSTNIYGEFGSLARPDAPITSELSSPDAPINSELSSQSQAGAVMQFGQGNFQHQMGPSDSMFSAKSQNEQAMQINNGDFGSQAGLTVPVTSQMSPLAPSGMDTPFNLGNFQHQAGPSASPFSPPQSLGGQYVQLNNGDFGSHAGPTTAELSQITQAQAGMNMPFNNGNFQNKNGLSAPPYSAPQTQNGQAMPSDNGAPSPQYVSTPFTNGNFVHPGGSSVGLFSHNMTPQTSNGSARQLNNNNFLQQQVSGPPDVQHAPSANRHILGNTLPQSERQNSQMNSQQPVSASVGSLALVPQQQSKEKFQTKSTVWSDTLSRGLVDLNISGPKTNPLADIGVDFDSINRKEKRLEKQSATPVTSTTTMGKAMGAGSGTGRAGAGTLKPLPNPTVGNMSMGMGGMGMVGNHVPNMGMGGMAMGGGHVSGFGMGGMGMGGGHGSGMGMGGGYGGMNQQPMGMGMGMGMNSGYNNMGMGMNPGMGQGGVSMQQPGNNMGMGMNPGMGQGGVSMQQPGNNMGMGMNPGMGQGGVSMQQPGNWYNNPMMGGNGYPQQPYGGGYR